jgi:hypothetical protein
MVNFIWQIKWKHSSSLTNTEPLQLKTLYLRGVCMRVTYRFFNHHNTV